MNQESKDSVVIENFYNRRSLPKALSVEIRKILTKLSIYNDEKPLLSIYQLRSERS